MPQTLANLSSTSLITAIEASLREFWKNWGSAPHSELYDGLDMLRLYTGVPYPFCNGVACANLSEHCIDPTIEATLMYFDERHATWEWTVGPQAQPAGLKARLEAYGLTVCGESVGMAIDLHAMNENILFPNDVVIRPVGDRQALEAWANTVVAGFESPELFPTFVDLECSLGCGRQPSYLRYLGLLNHQPVATSALFLGETVAGIYCVSTVPAARRQGIGAVITLAALREARAMGYRVAVLQASRMGRDVYQRLGFQEYSMLRNYRPTV